MGNQRAPEFEEKITDQTGELNYDKLWAIVAYFFFFLPLIFVKKRSAFLNFHINQGIILLIVSLAGFFGFDILPLGVSFLFSIFSWFWKIIIFALLAIGVMNVLEDKMKPLPIIGKLFSFLK